jgi:hypothetical protein
MKSFSQYVKDNFFSIFLSYLYLAIFLNIMNAIFICIIEKQEFGVFLANAITLSIEEVIAVLIYFGGFFLVALLKFIFRR